MTTLDESIPPPPPDDEFSNPLLANLPDYFNSSNLSDGIIRCSDRDFPIHRIILCTQSKFFAKAFSGDWKESAEGVIPLRDDNVSVVEAMLRFLYTFDYDASGGASENYSPMVFNVQVYSIADKYDIPSLKLHAKEKFRSNVTTCWDMDDFPNAIAEVYDSTLPNDQGLRLIAVDVACEHMNSLLQKQGFRDTLRDTAGFASGIATLQAFKLLSFGKKNKTRYRCPNCAKNWEVASSPVQSYHCPHCGSHRDDWKPYVVK